MLVLQPIVHETIWGGSRLSHFAKSGEQHIGHLYSVYSREECSNQILNGSFRGKVLNTAFAEFKQEFGMGEYDYFPLTIALTEAKQDLSIQVHPDDVQAKLLEHKARGKRESWYFLESPKFGHIVNGCKIHDMQKIRELSVKSRYQEIIDTMEVNIGDYVFIEPGTLHAICAGSLVYEIEEGADLTYRFYDYVRRDENGNLRELHIEKALECLQHSLKSVSRRYTPFGIIEEKTYATQLVQETAVYQNGRADIVCLTILDGAAEGDGVELLPGMSAILWPQEKVSGNVRLGMAAWLRSDA